MIILIVIKVIKAAIGIVLAILTPSHAPYGVNPLGALYLSGKIGINHHKNCPNNFSVYKFF